MKRVNVVASLRKMSEEWDESWCSARRHLVTAIKWSFDLETTQRSLQFCDTDVRSLASYPPSFFFCPLLFGGHGPGFLRIGIQPAYKGICITGVGPIQLSEAAALKYHQVECGASQPVVPNIKAKCIFLWRPAAGFQGTWRESSHAYVHNPQAYI